MVEKPVACWERDQLFFIRLGFLQFNADIDGSLAALGHVRRPVGDTPLSAGHGRVSAQERRGPDKAHVPRVSGVQHSDGSVAARPCAAPGLMRA